MKLGVPPAEGGKLRSKLRGSMPPEEGRFSPWPSGWKALETWSDYAELGSGNLYIHLFIQEP